MVVVESSGLTDVGMKRKGNEDALLFDDNLRLYIVADGMGGHQAGEVASSLVIKTMKDYMKRFNSGHEVEELEDFDNTLSKDANRLIAGINLSNQVVYQAAKSKASYRGMGSTVSSVYITNDTLITSNVGDSPIYLVRNNKIESLYVPHTVMAEQIAMNKTGDKYFASEYSHMLTRAMGIESGIKADTCELQCFKGDILVIASDGLTNKVSPEEILENVTKNKRPAKSCQQLVDMANERGGEDNITVIVLKIKSVKHKKSGIMGLISRLFRIG
ncbi:Phosphatase, PPM-type [Desulfonema limicola]|uniref:Phosphatase, PPM-type n=1 Tax=Desulfonema limicola TaxID=45656 RepID=A0A975B3A6_9BACT|nr:protein phosphatase 2C domain-containing protein [Desulfonema limicola]QTA78005.1 Phosphatase, PPM-type [Desulfonema limicola]